MKIAMIVPGGISPDGKQRVIPALVSLVKRLAARHQLRVIVFGENPPNRYQLFGAEVFDIGTPRLMPPNGRLPYRLAQTFRLLAGEGFDVMHAFWANHPGLAAGLCGRLLNIPVVLSIGGGELVWLPEVQYGGAGTLKRRIISREAIRRAQILTIGSKSVQAQLQRKAKVIPLGAESKFFAGPIVREHRPFRVLQVANLNRVKDPYTYLGVIEKILSQRDDVVFDWVGVDTLGGEIQRAAARFGDKVNFLGLQNHDELLQTYHRAHVYLQNSLYESQCVAISEAAAAGLPIVTTSVGIANELPREAAMIRPIGDLEGLAQAVSSLLDNESLRSSTARAAQAWAMTFDADWTATQFERYYVELIENYG